MQESRLKEILDKFKDVRIAVVGDFFLDRYFMIERALDELSVETKITAYQVTEKKLFPGAAGTITNNLAALGVGKIYAVGVLGSDGEGFELNRELNRRGVDTKYLVADEGIFTPTYTKPTIKEQMRELNRLDIRNRKPMPQHLVDATMRNVRKVIDDVDAIIVLDQVVEENLGIITQSMREFICDLSDKSEKIIYADSRAHLDKFSNIIVKCNNFEAASIAGIAQERASDMELIGNCAVKISQKTGKMTFVTCGERGIISAQNGQARLAGAVKVAGEIDICGAGDATTSGIVSALCSGATPYEASQIANIVSSITIRQIGNTGTATQQQVLHALPLLPKDDGEK